ncbi:protein phosphatase 1H [Agrilus planipennis]|uniref:Protein phosphatase 1H n=1 Tax=Agrilus planipennis TaxID=224129 RepID=A0A1W4W9C5_AGRPL|nr:protein phosphatase 1H [Agrilus planipennis]XP_018320593.1 protein phosphatase 1H [Agrilus planipennis]XP_018320595.1 protein phosphatase 1H [Agrilus planipennis]XP_018320596.1 protein phosphatase 1H [Agrilus planipennis]
MLNRFKNAVIGAVGGFETNGLALNQDLHQRSSLSPKFPYARPHFLELDWEQMQISADHRLRPIIHPSQSLAFNTGYAECINAGKSKWNEDQAVLQQGVLTKLELVENSPPVKYDIPYSYYGIFDGHAGVGAALCAANQLHHILHEKLVDAQDDIWQDFIGKTVSKPRDLLIIGALESGFREMDQLIAEDRNKYQSAGGCTALVALFILGKLYVANAGDSRAVICSTNKIIPMSMDFTPENERDRIRQLAEEQPALLGKEFTFREYICQPKSVDLGKPIMYRDAHMKGWAYKTLQTEDLKMPVITGQGKRSRVMGTIGVTRGFGDHDLLAVHQKTPIKPFLSPHPEVQVHKLIDVTEKDVLVMGTDGLWDVVSCSKAAEVIGKQFDLFSQKERYVSAATCLVGSARGILVNDHSWQLKNEKPASVDDISVFVIPLFPYRDAYLEFKSKYTDVDL